jgi:hypothetical protein
MKFVPAKPKTLTGRTGGEPPAWAIVVIVGTFGLIWLSAELGLLDSDGVIRTHVPFGQSDFFWVALIFLPIAVMLALMTGIKLWELRQAQGWMQASGRIVSSKLDVKRHRFEGEAERVENVPAVAYEFMAGGRKVIGSRIGIGDDAGGANTEATLKRYPRGATVTVYYDPDDPTQCVLERSGPAGLTARGCLGALAALAAVGVAVYVFIAYGPDFVAAHFPQSEPPIVLFATGFGLLLLMFFIAARRTSKQAQAWPYVRGAIVSSAVEEFQQRDSDGRLRTSYRPAVEFAYTVNGLALRSRQIKVGLEVSGSRGIAEMTVNKYPEGKAVDVHYDPADPSNAALENPTGATWVVLVLAVACFAVAVWQLGVWR